MPPDTIVHMVKPLSPFIFCVLFAVGCGPKEEKFAIEVHNATKGPLTIGLAKERGGPYEYLWATPEEAAMERVVPAQDPKAPRNWGLPVAAGKTAFTGSIAGRFQGEARPMLRVYGGDLTLEHILAVERGSRDRLDLSLTPGMNVFWIDERDGRLSAHSSERATTPTEPERPMR